MIKFKVIIPARYESSRFPGKALADIAGKPMIQHVYERVLKSGANAVVLATDDDRIRIVAEKFGAQVCMTSTNHQSGTDRLAEAVKKLGYSDDEIIVNVQGDEPLIPPEIIQQTAIDLYEHQDADVATLCEPITTTEQLFASNIAKVAFDAKNYALYFTRAPIPWDRDNFPLEHNSFLPPHIYYRHLGIYCYRAGFLKKFVTWKPCDLELIEHLEQLRMLYKGAKVYVGIATAPSAIGVDTPADLEKVRALI